MPKTLLPKPRSGVFKGRYHFYESPLARHRAIMQSLRRKREAPLSLGRHLLLLSTLTKRTIPKASRVYKMNARWLFSKSKVGRRPRR